MKHPLSPAKRLVTAYVLGLIDGWNQPVELSTSTNVAHLDSGSGLAWTVNDYGLNHGQFLHAGLGSQPWRESYPLIPGLPMRLQPKRKAHTPA